MKDETLKDVNKRIINQILKQRDILWASVKKSDDDFLVLDYIWLDMGDKVCNETEVQVKDKIRWNLPYEE